MLGIMLGCLCIIYEELNIADHVVVQAAKVTLATPEVVPQDGTVHGDMMSEEDTIGSLGRMVLQDLNPI